MTWRILWLVTGLIVPAQAQHFTGEISYLLTHDAMWTYGDTLRASDTLRIAIGPNGLWQSYIYAPSNRLHLTDGVYVLDLPPTQGFWLQHVGQAMQAPRPVPPPSQAPLLRVQSDTLLGIPCTVYERADDVIRMSTSSRTKLRTRLWLADKLTLSGTWQERVPGQPWWAWPATGKLVLRYEEWVWNELALRYDAVRVHSLPNTRIDASRFANPLPFNQNQLDSLLAPIQAKVSPVRRPGFHRRD